MMRLLNFFAVLKLWPYQVFAVLILAFISGIILGGFWAPDWFASRDVFLLLVFLLLFSSLVNLVLDNRILVLSSWLLMFMVLGLADYSASNSRLCQIPEGHNTVTGTIVSNPAVDFKQQQAILAFKQDGCNVRALVNLPHYPSYSYGQVLKLEGDIFKPGMIEDFDYERYLKPKFVGYLLKDPSGISLVGESGGARYQSLKTLYFVKNKVEDSISRSIREPEASLAAGILTGYRANISDETKNDLNNSGLTHLIALSGFNITIIITAIALLLSGWLSRRQVFIAGAILAITFIIMTGASASVVRAGIFSLLLLWGRTVGRRAFQTNILLLTAGLMLAFNPFLLKDDMGFQLSFLAFAGLIYMGKPVSYWLSKTQLRRLPDFIKNPLVETLSAQIAVFPLIAFAFGRISIISPLPNVLVLGLVPATMFLVFVTSISGLVLPLLGHLVGLISWPLLAYILQVARLSGRAPFAAINVTKYNIWLIAGLYLIIICGYWLTAKRLKRMRLL